MSTRSGKRIHSSFHENIVKTESETLTKSERKTRGKKLKENENNADVSVAKSKKRSNYVTYPVTDDEMTVDAAAQDACDAKPTRKLRQNTLKDHNIVEPVTQGPEINGDVKKVVRLTRRTKKFPENGEDAVAEVPESHGDALVTNGKIKTKKSKKKFKRASKEDVVDAGDKGPVTKKSNKKNKKKGKRSSDFIEEDIVKKDITLNKSNTSIDSYHSAAGSPLKENHNEVINKDNCEKLQENAQTEASEDMNDTLKRGESKRTSIKNSTFDKIDNDTTAVPNELNTTFDKRDTEVTEKLSTTFDKRDTEVTEKLSTTFDKRDTEVTEKLSTTFEKQTKTRKSGSKNMEDGTLNSTFEKARLSTSSAKSEADNLNATFDKTNKNNSKTASLNSTYDKDTDRKLDTTFDKSKSNSGKSSLISSDNTINVTFDKSDNSRISITSDDSRTENIVNTTPLLIESSLEESRISENLSTTNNLNTSQKDNAKESLSIPGPVTPLKREGTFTKDGPDPIIMSPKPKGSSSERTPNKSMSLPSPGFTPFHVTRSSQREKSVMNVTRSIEKPARRSSLADLAPRQTRVMFCSPTNNPGVATQQKKKVIKSSIKGSNKSFVFDESASDVRPANRKRSYTSDAEPTRAKRSRLAEGLQLSVDRLSRPRTSSAAAKLTDNTPKPATPAKSISKQQPSRTKLPNFAALHQKEFARMESLDECQERKAKRARQLLTPRAKSVRGTVEKPKPVQPAPTHSTAREAKKLETPANVPKTTLESLRPGFTRFGFKMHVDGNPFSFHSKTETKPKESIPNGLSRQATLPSIKGATDRKETAKQVILREKSFTSLSKKREVKRKEDRTIIKGVRTNRRFELQMQMRNIN